MTPPTLTDAWSIGYLQALIMLLVFAFGIPAFIYQTVAPENIRHIIKKYMKSILIGISAIVFFITFFALNFVWFLHPRSIPLNQCQEFMGALFISIPLIITPLIWWIVLVKFLREAVVNYLKKKLYRRFRKNRPILCPEMKDIITLGERSDAGYEKEVVLDAISNLIEKIQVSKRYTGLELEVILRNFDKIVTGIGKPGNESDFIRASNILEEIIGRFSARKFSNYGDEILIYWSLSEIGKRAAELRFSKVMLRIIKVAASNSGTLFEIGLSAFNTGDYSAATDALSKLETLALKAPKDEGQSAYDLLGLMAHFWTKNRSSRRCAEAFLISFEKKFFPLKQYLDRAIEDHYSVSRFDTADKLMTMRDDLMRIRGQ